MKVSTIVASLASLLLTPFAAAHNVDQNDVSTFVDDRPLFRVDYDDDIMTGHDRYYTVGAGLEVFHPLLKRSPLMGALIVLPGGNDYYGIAVKESLFTPSRVGERAAIPNDRPWAAYALLSHVLVSKDPAAGLALTTQLDTGVIGPAAGGKTAQKYFHKRLGLDVPRGWDNQVRDNPAVDYYARLEKTLGSRRWGDIGIYGDATAGTLYDNAAAGAQARVGRLDAARKNRYFVFARGEEKAVGYDATLQGGLFDRPAGFYTTPDSEVERFVYRWDVGVALDCGDWVFEATRTAIGREYSGAIPNQWGELTLMKRF